MRQVPQGQKKYGLIGSGKIAKHFTHFLKLKGFEVLNWSRSNDPEFNSLPILDNQNHQERLDLVASETSHILLAVNDDAIQMYADKYSDDHSVIHFSGSFFCHNSIGLHPLMTFGNELYEDSFYDEIPFVIDQQVTLSDLLPGLTNIFYHIDADKKNLYHSLCTMSGNFMQLLLGGTLDRIASELNIPSSAFITYLRKSFENVISDTKNLTGPFVRNDNGTINQHKSILKASPEHELYLAFEKYYQQKNRGKDENS